MDQIQAVTGLSERASAQTLPGAWESLLERIPYDWSHLLAEVELEPQTSYEDAALLVSALNPEHCDERPAFRFRVGREFGYGAGTMLVKHCLELLDEARIAGRLRLLEALSERRPVDTQGPVWRLEGRSL
jgi:hypothetical protein